MKDNRLTLFALFAVGFSCTTALFINLQPSYSQDTSSQVPNSSQTEQKVSQQELQKFARAYLDIQQIQKDSEKQMIQAVEGEGLSPTRFIEISKLQQNNQNDPTASELSPKEKQGFENAKAKIIEIKQNSESNIARAIDERGLETARFNQILTALHQNPQLREQLQQIIAN